MNRPTVRTRGADPAASPHHDRPGPAARPAARRSAARLARTTVSALPAAFRRARGDARFLVAYALLTAVLSGAALAVPVALTRAADAGLRSAVTLAGPPADVAIGYRFPPNLRHPEAHLASVTAAARRGVPAGLRAATRPPTGALLTAPARATLPDAGKRVDIGLAQVTGVELAWVEGQEPGTPPGTGEGPPVLAAAVARGTARELGIAVGDRVELALDRPVVLHVTGLFEPVRAGDGVWAGLPGVLAPVPEAPGRPARATVLLSRASLPAMFRAGARVQDTTVRFTADPAALSTRTLDTLRAAVAGAVAAPGSLTTSSSEAAPAVNTTLDAVLDTYADRLSAARAQASTVLAGATVAGILVLALAAGLLVERRRAVLELERARGASVLSCLVRAAAEAVPLAAAAGVAAGAAAAAVAWWGGRPAALPDGAWLPGVLVLAAAALVPVALAGRVAAGAGPARRAAANRRDRDRAARVTAAWRGWAEAGVVLLAAMAVAGAWHRGLVPDGDLLLAAAPALVAAACTVVVLRAVPPLARALARAASRGRGLIGLVAASRAAGPGRERGRRAGASPAAAVAAVTMTCALAVSCAAAATTVTAAQERAVGVVVGAEARIDRPTPDLAAAALRARPGVTAAAGTVLGSVPFAGDTDVRVTVLALDAAHFDHLSALAGAAGTTSGSTGTGPAGAVRAYLPPEVTDVAALASAEIYALGRTVPLDVAGTWRPDAAGPAVRPTGDSGLPVVVVDRAALAGALGVEPAELGVGVVWLSGPRADAAAADLARNVGGPGETGTVLTRGGYQRQLAGDALTSGLVTLYLAGAGAALLLGAAAVALTVQATAADRTRVLAVLRTLGVPARRAGRLAVAELAPSLGAAVLSGLAAGLLVAALLTSAQGLGLLAGGGDPRLHLEWWPFAAAALTAPAVLAVAAWLEARSRRQIRIGEVLRTW